MLRERSDCILVYMLVIGLWAAIIGTIVGKL
jgi:hypothetical protein